MRAGDFGRIRQPRKTRTAWADLRTQTVVVRTAHESGYSIFGQRVSEPAWSSCDFVFVCSACMHACVRMHAVPVRSAGL